MEQIQPSAVPTLTSKVNLSGNFTSATPVLAFLLAVAGWRRETTAKHRVLSIEARVAPRKLVTASQFRSSLEYGPISNPASPTGNEFITQNSTHGITADSVEASTQSKTRFMNAQNILKLLRRNPAAVVQTKDDLKCKALLTELGLINAFHKTEGPNMALVRSPQLRTHWVIGLCWTGYPEGNGYVVLFLPKLLFNEASLKEYVDDLIKNQGGTDVQHGEIHLPVDWPKAN